VDQAQDLTSVSDVAGQQLSWTVKGSFLLPMWCRFEQNGCVRRACGDSLRQRWS
jgi:hypothetical protein